jgi:decaprenylphospho-beta-D-ribofuranose 2-oxidase
VTTTVNGADRVLTGWGRTAPSRAYVTGPLEITRLLDRRVADAGGRVYLATDARLSRSAFTAMYGQLDEWRAVRERLDPRGVFCSDLGRRLGLC